MKNFANTIFYFLKANKKHSCVIKTLGKAINGGDYLGMKVPCRLLFLGEEKYINVMCTIAKLFSKIYARK